MGKKQLNTEEFIHKFLNHYGDIYDLSLVKYIDSNTKVFIKCSKHGVKGIIPFNLFRSHMPPCTECKSELIGFSVKDTETFIKKANIIHNYKYDYSNTIYKSNVDKVTINCLHHGNFEIKADNHLAAERGCPICAKEKVSLTTEIVLKRFNEIHKGKYLYPEFIHTNVNNYIDIECTKHGLFKQKIMLHLRGHGCTKCSNEYYTTETFINKSKLQYNKQFTYNKTYYSGYVNDITVTCIKHGDQITNPASHFQFGCLQCNSEKHNIEYLKQFKIKASELHNNKYDYSLSKYDGRFSKTKIICPKHGEFTQTIGDHLQGNGCPRCAYEHGGYQSSYENEIYEFISIYYKDEIKQSFRIEKKEIDIFIPGLNWGIEINGSYWHSHLIKPKEYHYNKNQFFNNYNISIFHIWEHDWINVVKKEVIKSMILNKLGLITNKIYARKCIIKEVSSKEYNEFCRYNHIQGSTGASIKLGLFFNNDLVSVMGFSTLRKNLGNSKSTEDYELIRFCNKINTNVVGGASKLLKYFELKYKPKTLVSYANEDYSKGKLYKILNFEDKGITNLTYSYLNPKNMELRNRFCYRKSELVKMGYDENKTEFEITHQMGLYRIYNSGTRKFLKIY